MMSRATQPITMISILAALLAGCGLGDSGGDGKTGPIKPTGPAPALPSPQVSCSTYTATISADIPAATSLTPGCYFVSGFIRVAKDARLELKPNTILVFDTGAALSIDGELNAVGTATQPIEFTGKDKTDGYWTGLLFPSTSRGTSRLENVIVQYGGGDRYNSRAERANIWIQAGNRADPPPRSLTVVNSNIGHSPTNGIYIGGNSLLKQLSRNLIRQNASSTLTTSYAGIAVDAAELHIIDTDNGFSDNGTQHVLVTGNNMADIPTLSVNPPPPIEWRALGVPYTVKTPISIGRDLNIGAGTQFEFSADASFTVRGDLATVQMKGSADRPITFTGQVKEAGSWKGMIIELAHTSLSPGIGTAIEMNHVIIEHGGRGQPSANLVLRNSRSEVMHNVISITDSTFRASSSGNPGERGGYGLYMNGAVRIEKFGGNKFIGNQFPVRTTPTGVPQLEADPGTENDYRTNLTDEVIIDRPENSEGLNTPALLPYTVGQSFRWPALNVPYHISRSFLVYAPLTLSAGLTLRFDPDTYLGVDIKGMLKAEGTATKPVTLTNASGTRETTTVWKGIYFYQGGTAADPNQLNFAVVENANNIDSPAGVSAMIQVPAAAKGREAFVNVANSTFRGGYGYGIYAGKLATVTSVNNTFEGIQGVYTEK